MAASPALAQNSWFVSVDGKSYGPYTDEQITAFVREGRLTPHSQVMRQGDRWSVACEQPQLAHLFAPAPSAAPTPVTAPEPSDAAQHVPTPHVEITPQPPAAQAAAPAPEAGSAAGEEVLAKVIIIAEFRTGSSVAFEAAVSRLGRSYRLNQYVWLLHTNISIPQLRKDLAPQVGRNDPLFIADTTNHRAAWINFGPGADATIKALWRGI